MLISQNPSVRPAEASQVCDVWWREELLWKRSLDLGCVACLALPALVLGVLIAALIKVSSPGPVLFKQTRVGYRGRRFLCLKFRTMEVNADSSVHRKHLRDLMTSGKPMTKLEAGGDSRLIPFGFFLRTIGMDELPQLFNVWRGDMSFVGPRPCIPYEFELFLPRHKRRCELPPGLTGLWQVSGKNRTTFEEMMDLDLEYVENRSFLLDLRIIGATIPALMVQALESRLAKRLGKPMPTGR